MIFNCGFSWFFKYKLWSIYFFLFIILTVSEEHFTYFNPLLSIIRFFNMQVLELSCESSVPLVLDWVPQKQTLGKRSGLKWLIGKCSQEEQQGREEGARSEGGDTLYNTPCRTQTEIQVFHHLTDSTGTVAYFSFENSWYLKSHRSFPRELQE